MAGAGLNAQCPCYLLFQSRELLLQAGNPTDVTLIVLTGKVGNTSCFMGLS